MRLHYGGDLAVTLRGPVTGVVYSFSVHQRGALVDPRDGLALLKTGLFRLQGYVRAKSKSADDQL